MPVVFQQPSPVTPLAGLGAATDVILKDNSLLASLYQAGLHAGRGGGPGPIVPASGGGGGRGGGGTTYVEPDQQQQQAPLRFSSGDEDYVGEHLQEKALLQQQQQAYQQQQLAALNGQNQQQPPRPVPEFNSQDQKAMDDSRNKISEIQNGLDDGSYIQGDPSAQENLMQAKGNLAALQQKQQAAAKFQQDQARQQQTEAQAHQDAQTVTRIDHLNKWIPTPPDQIPGMPPKHWKFDDKGVPVVDNEKERVAYMNHFYTTQQKQMEMKTRTDEAKDKQRVDSFRHHLDTVNKKIEKWDSDVLNSNKEKPDWYNNPEGEAKRRADAELEYLNGRKQGPGDRSAPSANGSAPKMDTADGQLKALTDFLGARANAFPTPAPRKTTEPPGPMSLINRARANGNYLGSTVPDPTMPAY